VLELLLAKHIDNIVKCCKVSFTQNQYLHSLNLSDAVTIYF